MTRRDGRAFGGQRVREATSARHWRSLTVLGAMSAEDLIATMTIEAPTDREVFSWLSGPVSQTEAQSNRCDGQPQLPQGRWGQPTDSRCWGRTALLAALLAGLQSHRERLVETQTKSCVRSRQDPRCAGDRSRSGDPRHLPTKRTSLVQALWLWSITS
jgi:hypothetical protein